MSQWDNLPPGPALRRIIAERAGWHMRKVWVGVGGIEYDFLIYDNDDLLICQREITAQDLQNEQQVIDALWLTAMEDAETPRWDTNLEDALWVIDPTPYQSWQADGQFGAWVGAEQYSASGETEPLALMRAWLAWAQEHIEY